MNIFDHLWVYLVLLLSSVVNIIVPISGSATITPLLALLTDPHRALGLTSFYLFLSGIIRIFLFRKDIDWSEIKLLLIPSAIASCVGAFLLKEVPGYLLLWVVFIFTLYFFLKKLNFLGKKETSSLTSYVTGLFSGFLQGAGLAGSDLRNSYLYAQGLSLSQVHGTTAVIGATNFLIATLVRIYTGQVTIPDLTPLLYIFPFMIIAIWIGRRIIYKLSETLSNKIVIGTMAIILFFLGIKLFTM